MISRGRPGIFFNAYEWFTDGVGQPTKDTLPFFRAWQFMPLAFETNALYAF